MARLDTADLPSCGDVIDELVGRLDGVDVFVSNAGTGTSTLALDMTFEEWRHVMTRRYAGLADCRRRLLL